MNAAAINEDGSDGNSAIYMRLFWSKQIASMNIVVVGLHRPSLDSHSSPSCSAFCG